MTDCPSRYSLEITRVKRLLLICSNSKFSLENIFGVPSVLVLVKSIFRSLFLDQLSRCHNLSSESCKKK